MTGHMFICDARLACQAAGIRLKPLPKKRWQRLRLRRRAVRQLLKQAKVDEDEMVTTEYKVDATTGISFIETTRRRNGEISITIDICIGTIK